MALLPFCSQWTQFLHCVVECKSFYTGLLNPKFLHRYSYCYCSHWTQFLHRVVKCKFFYTGLLNAKALQKFCFCSHQTQFLHRVAKSKSPLKCPAQSANEEAGEQIVAKLQNNSKKISRAQYVQSIQLLDLRVTSPLTVFLKYGQLDFSKAFDSISDHLISIFPEIC